MINYIKESIERFRKDALSKTIYDFLKWLIPTDLLFAATRWLPENLSLARIISARFEVTVYWSVIFTLSVIILTILIVRVSFRRKYNALEIDNFTDELTGLKNHKALKEHLTRKMLESKSKSEALSLIIIDIDDFKSFNTTVGYNTADKILKKIAELLSNDKRATDETFRQFLRGDEFLVVATETNLHGALLAAERKRKLIQNAILSLDGHSFHLTVSCGVTEFKRESDDYTTITDRVLVALNEAKQQQGKNCTKTII